MQTKLQKFKATSRTWIAMVASNLEVLISAVVIAAIIVVSVRLCGEVIGLAGVKDFYSSFNEFLGHAFNVIIGIEFIKMLSKHTPGSAIEVLLFTIAREMVVNHKTPLENLIGIITIAIIFIIRKFLFVHSFGEHIPNEDETSHEESLGEEQEISEEQAHEAQMREDRAQAAREAKAKERRRKKLEALQADEPAAAKTT